MGLRYHDKAWYVKRILGQEARFDEKKRFRTTGGHLSAYQELEDILGGKEGLTEVIDTQFMLEHIQQPEDLKNLTLPQLEQLCGELRDEIIGACASNGGHLASNLGTVELTVALHRVFHSPHDAIVWDVGHQSYTHKLLTGRRERFRSIRTAGGLSGFQTPRESCHDRFVTGHAGTALSSAMGLAESLRLAGNDHDRVIAVVGDGALGNGITLEALDSLRDVHGNFLLIVNDNKMSISKCKGTLAHSLTSLITSQSYNRTKQVVRDLIRHLPGQSHLLKFIARWEARLKNLLVSSMIFEEVGFRYIGPVDGHQLPLLIKHLERIRHLHDQRPILFHVITEKGHGCPFALAEPERFHGTGPFEPTTGRPLVKTTPEDASFSQVFGSSLLSLAEKHEDIVALSAAMTSGTGLSGFAQRFPQRFLDTGITEEHAVVFSGGLAAGGVTPFLALYATFMQRALDCVYHDICLAGRHVVFCIDRVGAVEDGPTHHGFYDLPMLVKLPQLSILYPADGMMLTSMLEMSYAQSGPIMVRYPKAKATSLTCPTVPPLAWGQAAELVSGKDVTIWALGREVQTALAVSEQLSDQGISASVVDVRFLQPFDVERLVADASTKRLVTLEDGIGTLEDLVNHHLTGHRHEPVMHLHWPAGQTVPHGKVEVLRQQFGLSVQAISARIQAWYVGSETPLSR